MKSKLQTKIADKAKLARIERKFTQREIAKLLGLSQSRYSEIENGSGSFTAEQFVTLMKHYNRPLSYFVGDVVDNEVSSQLQNALSRLGAKGLYENWNVLPSEKVTEVNKVIQETIIAADSARHITALAPVIVNNYDKIDFDVLSSSLSICARTGRLGWIFESTIEALQVVLEKDVLERNDKLLYLRAISFLGRYIENISIGFFMEDFLDKNIVSDKTLKEVKEARTELAKKWKILTRITTNDFVKALRESRI